MCPDRKKNSGHLTRKGLKRNKETSQGMMDMFITLTVGMVSAVYAHVKPSNCTFKYMQFIMCHLYLNKGG